MPTHQPQLTNLGLVTDLTWLGSIAAKDLHVEAPRALEQLDDYYVPVNLDAAVRCIDGRPDPTADDTKLGPQVPGGTPGAALARHLSGGTAPTMAEEAKLLIDATLKKGWHPGGHRDELNAALPTSGCGAVDKMDLSFQVLVNPDYQADIKRLVTTLLGESFDAALYEAVLTSARELQSWAPKYFADRSTTIDYLDETAPGSAPVLQGVHNEYFILINTVPHTTFATSRFDNDYSLQAFGYDFWYTAQYEAELFDADERATFVTARVMTAIAKLMVLTDGTQRLIVRA